MDFESIADVLGFAISKEQASEQFYLDMAGKMTDSATQSIFQAIARQERSHVESLKLELMKAGYTVRVDISLVDADEDSEWDGGLEVDDQARHMTYADGLLLAIQKERSAFQLYAQLVGMAENLELRKLLLELAEEEMRHVLQFEREYETVTHHHKE